MNVHFLNQLVVSKSNGHWIVERDFCALVQARNLIVPAGFKTDFASVPRLPIAYSVFGNTAHKSAVLHDWLYTKSAGREYADKAFLAAMKAEGISAWRRWAMYTAVRMFGWTVYRKREKSAEERFNDDVEDLANE